MCGTRGADATSTCCAEPVRSNYGHNPEPIVRRVTDYIAAGGPVQSLDLHTKAKAEFIERFAAEVLAPRGMDHVMQFPARPEPWPSRPPSSWLGR